MSFLEVVGLLVLVLFALKLAPFFLLFVPIVVVLFVFGGIIGTGFLFFVIVAFVVALFGKVIRINIH